MIELESEPSSTMVEVERGDAARAGTRAARPRSSSAGSRRREAVIAIAAIIAAVAAVWVTLRADFLAYPGWLAAQKADIILGPVLAGLYWLRRRPASRFGPIMIAVGFLSVPYILQSSAAPWAFSLGVLWEGPIFVTTLALILAFPTGRLDGTVERLILAVGGRRRRRADRRGVDAGAADRRRRHDLQLQRRLPGERVARLSESRAGARSSPTAFASSSPCSTSRRWR